MMPLTLNYFPFRSIFPTLKTLSALPEKRNSAEVCLKTANLLAAWSQTITDQQMGVWNTFHNDNL